MEVSVELGLQRTLNKIPFTREHRLKTVFSFLTLFFEHRMKYDSDIQKVYAIFY